MSLVFNGVYSAGGSGGEPDAFPLPEGYTLPSGFTKLRYALSSGYEAINTHIHPTLETRIEIAFTYEAGRYNSWCAPAGCLNPLILPGSSIGPRVTRYFGFGDKNDFWNPSDCRGGGIPIFTIDKTGGKIEQSGLPTVTQSISGTAIGTVNPNTTIGLFCRYNGTTFERNLPMAFYRSRIWDNDILQGYYYPVLDEAMQEVVIIDILTDSILHNVGGGALIGGLL